MNYPLRIITPHEDTTVSVQAGVTLFEALHALAGAPPFPCGGRGVCGKCRVKAWGALSRPEPEELTLLGAGSPLRLACFARVMGPCTVEMGHEAAMQIVTEGTAYRAANHGAPMFRRYGAAVDIGTTTLCARLYGPDGAILGGVSRLNPQSRFGADVISRIGAAMAGEAGALQQAAASAVLDMLRELCAPNGISPAEVDALVITGNTTMLYLLAGRDPEPLSHAPFAADALFGGFWDAGELGLGALAGTRCYLPRCMHAFVGADITTALLASGMLQRPQTAVLVDIGTNGEMALWHEGELFCCSTAAGPAFEGAGIEMGSHGIPGAIDAVHVQDGQLVCRTIGGVPAQSICGSGIIDATAALLQTGALDETGRLASGEQAALTPAVYLTQKDVRMIQLAKSAIRAGLETLLHEKGLRPADVGAFYIAGGFGSFLNLQSAADIGLFPAGLLGAAQVMGNAALAGASMLLCDEGLCETSEAGAKKAAHVALAANPFFMDQYMENMLFEAQ